MSLVRMRRGAVRRPCMFSYKLVSSPSATHMRSFIFLYEPTSLPPSPAPRSRAAATPSPAASALRAASMTIWLRAIDMVCSLVSASFNDAAVRATAAAAAPCDPPASMTWGRGGREGGRGAGRGWFGSVGGEVC